MRLIDADALLEKFPNRFENINLRDWCIPIETIRFTIDNTPTHILVPKRGKWIADDDGVFSCSACQKPALQKLVEQTNLITEMQTICSHYCPNCGAKMDS